MLKPGDLVFTESPSYDRTITCCAVTARRWSAFRSRPTVRTRGVERALRSVPKSSTSSRTSRTRRARRARGRSGGARELSDRYGFLLVEDAPVSDAALSRREEPTLYELARTARCT